MSPRQFALLIGIAFGAAGVLGFVPGFQMHPPAHAPDLAVPANYGYLFGLFPVNLLHNVVHLAVCVLGLLAYRNGDAAIMFCRGLAVFYGVLAVMGLIPALKTTFGLIPIFGHDVWLHAGTAALAAYFGWAGEAHRGHRVAAPRHA